MLMYWQEVATQPMGRKSNVPTEAASFFFASLHFFLKEPRGKDKKN